MSYEMPLQASGSQLQPVAPGANYPSDRLDPPLLNDDGSGRRNSRRDDRKGRAAAGAFGLEIAI